MPQAAEQAQAAVGPAVSLAAVLQVLQAVAVVGVQAPAPSSRTRPHQQPVPGRAK